jgi:hypothetical protein
MKERPMIMIRENVHPTNPDILSRLTEIVLLPEHINTIQHMLKSIRDTGRRWTNITTILHSQGIDLMRSDTNDIYTLQLDTSELHMKFPQYALIRTYPEDWQRILENSQPVIRIQYHNMSNKYSLI